MEQQPEQPKKTAREIYSQEVLVDLLLKAKFVNVLNTDVEVAIHNDRMELIQEFISGDGEKYLRFINELARMILSL